MIFFKQREKECESILSLCEFMKKKAFVVETNALEELFEIDSNVYIKQKMCVVTAQKRGKNEISQAL